jgi:hypothetical protein
MVLVVKAKFAEIRHAQPARRCRFTAVAALHGPPPGRRAGVKRLPRARRSAQAQRTPRQQTDQNIIGIILLHKNLVSFLQTPCLSASASFRIYCICIGRLLLKSLLDYKKLITSKIYVAVFSILSFSCFIKSGIC